ncbi:probable RNA-directed DNA polymerase from transposon BS [Trichonephila clavipes]|nr:probable RNA-directed DNA polymerase from transposon BS [Trichonephila clavipes]
MTSFTNGPVISSTLDGSCESGSAASSGPHSDYLDSPQCSPQNLNRTCDSKANSDAGDVAIKEEPPSPNYRKGHGAVDQILYFCQRIRDAQNNKPTNHTVAALLDMSRAFDRVWRQLLITKIYDYFSIRGRALPWISDFLWDRSIRVKYNNCLSDPFAIRQGAPQGSVLSPVLFSLYITGIEKVSAKHCEVGIFADDIIVRSSGSDVGENELKLNRAMEEAHSFAEMHKLTLNASKSLTTFFSTNRHLFNYQPKISMNGIQLCYVKNAKYLGYTLDQEITSNKHIEGQVIKARKRINVLKFISGRDWGAEASSLRTTFISFIRPVLEFGIPIYSCASDTNLNKLERVQLCAARIITGLRYSCQIDIVLFESNLPSLSKRRLYSLTRYFNKLYSYNKQHRTSAYLHAWINNRRLMKHSPFSYARAVNLPSSDVEPHSLSFAGTGLELDGIYFYDQLLTSVTKSSEIPALVNQLVLETINGIPQSSLKIYTDGSRGEKGISGNAVYIPTHSGALEFKIKNPNYCSVFRSELIAIRRGLQCAAQLADRFQEIWILTDSRASIQHLANWGNIGGQTSLDILSLLHDLSSGHSMHFQ